MKQQVLVSMFPLCYPFVYQYVSDSLNFHIIRVYFVLCIVQTPKDSKTCSMVLFLRYSLENLFNHDIYILMHRIVFRNN